MVLEVSLRVRKAPQLKVNRGPRGKSCRDTKNLRMALTGQVEDPVAPIRRVQDSLKRSIFEHLRWMERELKVTSTSSKRSWWDRLYLVFVRQEYSLALRKP